MNSFSLVTIPAPIISVIIFCLVFLLNWLGFRLHKRIRAKNISADDGLGTAEGSMLGLMALILAFAFSMASGKFEDRRQILISEANDIGTAILRCDLYPDSARNFFLENFKKYLESRINYYDAGDDEDKISSALKEAGIYSGRIWKKAAELGQNPANMPRTSQMIPALNSMIDIVTTREAARLAPVHPLILSVLLLLAFTSSFLAGYGIKVENWNPVLIFTFALMTTLALFLVMELGRPRQGLINLDKAEQAMLDLRSMLPPG